MTLQKLLKGYRLGFPQSVGNMRVIPILADTEFTKVGDMENIYLKRDEAYETLLMANDSQYISVIPHGLMYVVAEKAQDRAIPSAHLIAKDKRVNANCLQPSQSGSFEANNKEREWGILPSSLKSVAWEHADDHRYDALWGDIEKFLDSAGLSNNELVRFFKEFKNELETFIAQFEPVDKQVGAIFIINNVLIGIEIVPNYKIWQQMWRPLVRDCYGSEAIMFIKKGYTTGMFHPILKHKNIKTIEDLEKATNDLLAEEKEFTNEVIQDVLTESMENVQQEELEDFTLYNLTSEQLMGQCVTHGPEKIIYASLITKHSEKGQTRKRKFNSRWNNNSPYREDHEFALS